MWHDRNLTRARLYIFRKKIKKIKKFKKKIKKFHSLTRVLYGHDVNSNLTEMTKLNPFK